jgi:hypothetical protein
MPDSRQAELLASNRNYRNEILRETAEMRETVLMTRKLIEATYTCLREADRLVRQR